MTSPNNLIDTLDGHIPALARVAISRPRARQLPVTSAKTQTDGETTKVNLDEIEQTMMREMERTLQKSKSE